ncbi:MAG TPA: dienelactone hydrolase family protein [Roseiflexaceae bacterium]|nr:dienelactone hydrolase family protein [Roseiflexaceae bacterium]
MVTFEAGDQTGTGYLAIPERGHGPGVLVLHAWWGLKPFFTTVCDQLASAGFVALAPDLYQGRTAATVEEAEALLKQRDFELMQATATGALAYLRGHSAARGAAAGTIGFSMGAAWALELASAAPQDIAAAVLFYGVSDSDFGVARAAYLGHFAEEDEWEPLDGVRQMESDMRAAGRDVTIYIYPGVKHWFVEADRPEYNPEAAELAWQRTLDFLNKQLM